MWTSCFEVVYCTLKYLKVLRSTPKYHKVRWSTLKYLKVLEVRSTMFPLGLLPRFSSRIKQYIKSSSVFDGIFSSESSSSLDKNSDSAQQHTIPFDLEDFDENDADWLLIASDEEHYVKESSNNSTKVQSAQKFSSYRNSQSSSSASSLSTITTTSDGFSAIYEKEEKTISSHSRTHTALEIAVLLSLFRHRHSLSKSCITYLCYLLRLLGVQNVPADYRWI